MSYPSNEKFVDFMLGRTGIDLRTPRRKHRMRLLEASQVKPEGPAVPLPITQNPQPRP
ncbi:MAG TPA: hypothetical protein VN436_12250 [Holophaga sp.]|nr:hypothetical protein [Holophaga sp.]